MANHRLRYLRAALLKSLDRNSVVALVTPAQILSDKQEMVPDACPDVHTLPPLGATYTSVVSLSFERAARRQALKSERPAPFAAWLRPKTTLQGAACNECRDRGLF